MSLLLVSWISFASLLLIAAEAAVLTPFTDLEVPFNWHDWVHFFSANRDRARKHLKAEILSYEKEVDRFNVYPSNEVLARWRLQNLYFLVLPSSTPGTFRLNQNEIVKTGYEKLSKRIENLARASRISKGDSAEPPEQITPFDAIQARVQTQRAKNNRDKDLAVLKRSIRELEQSDYFPDEHDLRSLREENERLFIIGVKNAKQKAAKTIMRNTFEKLQRQIAQLSLGSVDFEVPPINSAPLQIKRGVLEDEWEWHDCDKRRKVTIISKEFFSEGDGEFNNKSSSADTQKQTFPENSEEFNDLCALFIDPDIPFELLEQATRK